MKNVDLFALGNAIVDYEIDTHPEQLTQLSVEKGVMTLVDEARQQQLIEALSSGTQHFRACGGSAANSVIAAARLGLKCYLTCKVAADEPGDFYLRDLTRHQVGFNRAGQFVAGKTGKCLVMITPDADRTMNTFLGRSADIGPECLDQSILAGARVLYVEGYLVTGDNSFALCQQAMQVAQQNNTSVAVSLSDPNIVKFFKDKFHTLLAEPVNWLFCNLEEALELTGAQDLDGACDAISRYAKETVITLGAEGVAIVNDMGVTKVAGAPTKAIDTNGAGDMFAGTFLSAVLKGASIDTAAKLANIGASQVVANYGPRLSDELMAEFVQKFNSKL